ncbi:MAG: alpha/beta hydrolase [Acidimicrobiales bacterium]
MVGVAGVALLGGDVPDPGSAQAPRAAAAVPVERRVHIDGAVGVSIGGTVTMPTSVGAGGGVAGVVIIPGFGPTNRDGKVGPGGAADTFYLDLSRTLVDSGMATLRYDKRGTGQSVLPPDRPLTFDDMVADAGAAVAFLAERAEVDPQRIAVVGHEEGGLVALQLAADDPRVASLALVSVPGRPFLQVLTDDFNNSGHGDQVPALQGVVGGLLAGEPLPDPATISSGVRDFFPVTRQEYLIDIFSLDPVVLAGQVDVPVLVVRGDAATGISAADADALVGALGPETEVVVAPDAGPTLVVADSPAGAAASSGSTSGEHEHDQAPAAPVPERDEGAMARIDDFIIATAA